MAELDPSIYNGMLHPPPAVEGPMDMLSKATALKTAMGRAAAQPLELEQTRLENEALRDKANTAHEDTQDQKTLQELYGQVQMDKEIPPEKKLEELRTRAAGKVKPRTIETLSKQIQDHQTALEKLHDDQLISAKKVTDEVGNTAAGIMAAAPEAQPGLYAQERARLIQSGIATPDHIPEAYDPEWLKMAAAHAMGGSNAVEAEMKRRTDKRAQEVADRTTRLSELADFGQTIDSVDSQEAYTARREKLSPANKALTAATWTPANVATIKRISLTAQQQQQADESARTAAETKRHDLAGEEKKGTYTGDLRAALVATGAKDPDNPTPAEAGKALDRVKPQSGEKPASKAALIAIETRKGAEIRKSKATLDKALATAVVGGKVIDQDAVDTAWEDHIGRLQEAQTSYENELGTATGQDVGHNDWADKLRAPGKGEDTSQGGAPPAAGAAPNPKAKALVSKYKKGDVVTLRGKKVKITAIDPETGNFDYDPE